MTVSTQANKAQFNGAGTTGPFTFNFRFFNNSEIFAIKTSSTGVDTDLSETVDYTLTGSGSYSGGSLSLVSSLAVGEKLTVYRVLPLTQATDLRNQGAFFAEVHEDAFDKLTMIVQQHEEELDRAVQIPITSDITPTEYLAVIEAIKDEAETAQAGAEAAQAGAEAVLDEFTDIYLGVKASDPTTDNDGNALQEGALYWNSTAHRMRVYETGAWTDVTVSSSFTVDTFSGTGAQTAFTLSANPGTKNNTVVTISGVYQQKATYSVSGTTLTFTTAPPSGTSNIEVCIASTVSLNVPANNSVTTSALQDGAITNAKLAFDGGRSPYAFYKSDFASVAFVKTGAATLSIKAGAFCLVGTTGTMVSWSTQTAVTMPSHTIGTDYYIYACADGSIRADANATNPTGYDTSNSRKIGGYHYGRVRNTLTVTDVATEIVPRSLWDLTYRPKCNPAGMVDVHGNGSLWADIYEPSVDSAITLTSGVVTAGTCKSIYNGTPLSGTEGLHGYNFIELAKNSGKRLLSHSEWLAVAHGSPQGNNGDNLNAWSATTNSARTTTGQVARAVSFCGACDCVGNLWECTDEWSNDYSATITAAWFNPMSGQNVGQQYLYNPDGLRMYLAGGASAHGVFAGSRALYVNIYPWYVSTNVGSRFACDGL